MVGRLQAVSLSLRLLYIEGKSGNQGFRCLLASWRAPEEDSMCVFVCPSWRMSSGQTGRGSVASLFSCGRARRVKSCRDSLTHTLRSWGLSQIHTMRPRSPGLGLGPRALGSHTLNQYFNLHGSRTQSLSRCSEWLAAPLLRHHLFSPHNHLPS